MEPAQPESEYHSPAPCRRYGRLWGALTIVLLVGIAGFTLAGMRQASTSSEPTPTPPYQAGRAPGFHGEPFVLVVWRPTREGYLPRRGVRPAAGKAFVVVWIAVYNFGYREVRIAPGDFEFETDTGQVSQQDASAPHVRRTVPTTTLSDKQWEWGYAGFSVDRSARQGRIRYVGPLRAASLLYDERVRQALAGLGMSVPQEAHPPQD